MFDNKIGEKIARLRKEKGLTQKELGEKLFVTDKAVSKWERGLSLPDITLLEKLAKELDIDIYDLFGLEERNKDDVLKVIKEEKSKLEKQFSDITDGYSYDDFMKDFGSIENGFEGADEEEIAKAKMLAGKIEKLKNKLNIGEINSKAKSIEKLKRIGIELKNSSSADLPDEIYSKFADFIVNFENNHPGYFSRNKLQLDSITIIDALKENGVSAGGAYYSNSRSIKIMRKAIETKPKSKLITYSKSDDYELHFLAHEYGHYIADSLEKNFSITDYDIVQNSLLKYFDNDIFMAKTSNLMNDLGSYGSRNAKEAFAEAFAEAYTSENPRKFARIFKEELEKILKRKNK